MVLGFRTRIVAIASALLAITACSVGTIEGPDNEQSWRTKKDSGAPRPGDPPPEDDPAPPPPEDPGSPDAEPPPSDPPAGTDSGAPPPPSDGGSAPPVSDSSPPPADTSPPPTPPPTGAYPAGPYGFTTGSVFPNASVSGYRDGVGAWTTIKMADYYDPDGSRKINGILIAVSASWCGACREEAKSLPSLFSSTYKPRGAKFITALIEDVDSSPAKQSTVDTWISSFKCNFDVVADPSEVLVPKGSIGLPHNTVVDPRTMKVVKVWEGADTSFPGLDSLLTANGG